MKTIETVIQNDGGTGVVFVLKKVYWHLLLRALSIWQVSQIIFIPAEGGGGGVHIKVMWLSLEIFTEACKWT